MAGQSSHLGQPFLRCLHFAFFIYYIELLTLNITRQPCLIMRTQFMLQNMQTLFHRNYSEVSTKVDTNFIHQFEFVECKFYLLLDVFSDVHIRHVHIRHVHVIAAGTVDHLPVSVAAELPVQIPDQDHNRVLLLSHDILHILLFRHIQTV